METVEVTGSITVNKVVYDVTGDALLYPGTLTSSEPITLKPVGTLSYNKGNTAALTVYVSRDSKFYYRIASNSGIYSYYGRIHFIRMHEFGKIIEIKDFTEVKDMVIIEQLFKSIMDNIQSNTVSQMLPVFGKGCTSVTIYLHNVEYEVHIYPACMFYNKVTRVNRLYLLK